MHLIVKRGASVIDEYEFAEGPIHIGRRESNQICLRHPKISKQHAIIFNTGSREWMVQDLDSANKTYLNGQAVHKAKLNTGDTLRITVFSIEIDLEREVSLEEHLTERETIDLSVDEQPTVFDAVANEELAEKPPAEEPAPVRKSSLLLRDTQIIARKPGAEQPSPIRFPGERAVDFLQATEAIARAGSIDNVLLVLLSIMQKQFGAYQVWAALRNNSSGPMIAHAGKQRDGKDIELKDIKLSEKINESIDEGECLLYVFSREPDQDDRTQIRSVLMSPVISPSGCFGILYVNNSFMDDHYNLGGLDYLMLVAMHTATVLEKL